MESENAISTESWRSATTNAPPLVVIDTSPVERFALSG